MNYLSRLVPVLLWLSRGTMRAAIIIVAVLLLVGLLYVYAWQPLQDGVSLPRDVTLDAPRDFEERLREIDELALGRLLLQGAGGSFGVFEPHFLPPDIPPADAGQ